MYQRPSANLDRRARCALLAGLLCSIVTLTACDLPGEGLLGEEASEIVGGQIDIGDPAVVYLSGSAGNCTGTLVADTVVLTAAHCLPQSRVYFGQGTGEFVADRRVIQQLPWRHWDPDDAIRAGNDIALLRLDEPAPADIEPLPINTEPLDESYIGLQIRVVGFGMTDGVNETGAGTKRFVNLQLRGVTAEHIAYGDEFANTCRGDSGGPNFLDFDGTERIIGVTSFGSSDCLGESRKTRTDVYVDAFLNEVIDAWSGPCKQDADCVTEGCRTPDPDCDVCGFDGICATGCDKKDLDCPLSGLLGDTCEDREDCESLLCLASPEDSRVKYCSTPCDPENADDFWSCRPPLSTCVAAGDGTHYCRHAGLTPGVQGYECDEHSECRSSICYPPGDGICAEQCGDGLPACADDYSCENIGADVDACIIPEGGGCCQTTAWRSNRSTAGLLFLAGLVALLLSTRSRRRV